MVTTNGGGAGGTLLGIKVAETVEAIGKVISGGKPLASQLLLAASAQEAVLVPGLVMVGHPSSSDGLIRGRGRMAHCSLHFFVSNTGIIIVLGVKMGATLKSVVLEGLQKQVSYLLAVRTLHGKLLLVAGHTVVVVVLRDEALGANGLLASLAGETGLVPAVPLMLHLPGAFRET